jgi:hypothetical protein
VSGVADTRYIMQAEVSVFLARFFFFG